MKTCIYCGKEHPDEAVTCAADGQALQAVPPPLSEPPPGVIEQRRIIDEEHIRLLSIFHFVVAGLACCGLAFLFLHYCLMSMVFNNPDLWKHQPRAAQMPENFFKIFIWVYIIFGLMITCAGAGNLLSAIFLRQKKHRTFSLVVAGLNCLQIPLGTILGVFTIIVLSRDSTCKIYSKQQS